MSGRAAHMAAPPVLKKSGTRRSSLLRWALVFLVFALIAGLLGFTGIAGEAMYIARILFFIFLVVFLVGLVYSLVTGKRPGGA